MEDPGAQIIELYDQERYEEAVNLVSDYVWYLNRLINSRNLTVKEKAETISKRTTCEKIFQLLKQRSVKHNHDQKIAEHQRKQEIEQHRREVRLSHDSSGFGEYHIDSEILARAEQYEQIVDWQ